MLSGRSVLPIPLLNNVSPENRILSSLRYKLVLPFVCPGVSITDISGIFSFFISIMYSSGKSFLFPYISAFSKRLMFPMWSKWLWVSIIVSISYGRTFMEFKSIISSFPISPEPVSINPSWGLV